MAINPMNDFFEYLEEASRIVATWPKWKQDGSDATQFLENHNE